MKITSESYLGIRLQDLYAATPATPEQLNERRRTVWAHGPNGVPVRHELDVIATFLELVQLSPADEMHLLNCAKKTYVLTARAKEVIDAIAVSKLLPVSRLVPLLARPRCICTGAGSAYFLWADEGTVKAVLLEHVLPEDEPAPLGTFGVAAMSFDLRKVYEVLDVFNDSQDVAERQTLGMLHNSCCDLIRLLIFLELTDPEITVVAAGKKHSQAPVGYTNTAGRPVLIVDSTWNKFIVRVEGFGVRGHFRVQPCGPGLSELKLLWIDAYQKNGYVRPPKSGAVAA